MCTFVKSNYLLLFLLCLSGAVHALSVEDLRQIDRGMDFERDVAPVLDHGADVVVTRRLEHEYVRIIAAQHSVKADGLEAGRLGALIPPFARFCGDIDVNRGPRFGLDERNVEHRSCLLRSTVDRGGDYSTAGFLSREKLAGLPSVGCAVRRPFFGRSTRRARGGMPYVFVRCALPGN